MLQLGRKLGHRRGLPRVSVTLAGEECVWLCRLGRYEAALELARAQDFDRTLHPQYGMTADKAARVAPRLLMAEQPEMAIAQLGPPLVRATEKGFHHRRVELLILHAAALLRAGRTTEALQSWRIALEVGERFGYRRVVPRRHGHRDDTEPRGARARRVPAARLAQARTGPRRGPRSTRRSRARNCASWASWTAAPRIAKSPTRCSCRKAPLKWHLHNIYRKLGCRNRSGAIAAARRQGLL